MRYRLASDVRFRVVGGEGVVVLQEAAEVLVVNGVAARVLELLDPRREPSGGSGASGAEQPVEGRSTEGRSAEELIARLAGEYEAPREEIAADVRGFLAEILEVGVVVAVGSGDSGDDG